jgi:hypothetical protein
MSDNKKETQKKILMTYYCFFYALFSLIIPITHNHTTIIPKNCMMKSALSLLCSCGRNDFKQSKSLDTKIDLYN